MSEFQGQSKCAQVEICLGKGMVFMGCCEHPETGQHGMYFEPISEHHPIGSTKPDFRAGQQALTDGSVIIWSGNNRDSVNVLRDTVENLLENLMEASHE